MTPQFQQHTGEGDIPGDCMRACIASLLDLPIDSVPHVALRNGTQPKLIDNYLSQIGMRMFTVTYTLSGGEDGTRLSDVLDTLALTNPGAYFIVTGVHPSGAHHVVIAQDGKVVHDPLGEYEGLLPYTIGEGIPAYDISVIAFRGRQHARALKMRA